MSYTNGLDKPTDYFNTKLYTGNGSTQSITGVGFQPDFTWIKDRDGNRRHYLFDAVRGVYKELNSDDVQAEENKTNSLTNFDSDGFTVSDLGDVNFSGDNFASWNWKANGTGVSNTDGSITSTVSANTTSGFSIVSYTGTGANATVGHGLGVAPNMIINKCRTATQNWATYHSSLGGTKALFLDGDDAETSSVSYFNNTNPTSSVFSVGNSGDTNKSSQTHISYCFAEKKGFSKFKSYVGNGNADGTFIYTGFKPAFVIFKRTSGTQDWGLFDNKRSNYNPVDELIYPNYSLAESGDNANKFDFVSNGFKLRASGQQMNQSGDTYIYMAFAENPFVTSTGIPTVAR